ncbi:hypothetical protein CTZ27_22715 [Streptomyces griseocarneus]|nr:hypothetical protein CTZ27_22715 [Streptomyces griseocarneus]
METYFIAAMCDVHADREAEFNEWYDARHVPELLRLPGFRSVRRMILTEYQFPTGGSSHTDGHYRHLSLIEIEADDLQAALAGLAGLERGPVESFLVSGRVMTSLYRQHSYAAAQSLA